MKAAVPERLNVVLAFRNDIQRLGVERILHDLDVVGAVTQLRDLAGAAAYMGDGAATPPAILVGDLREVDTPTAQVLHDAAERRVRVLLLVDLDDPRLHCEVGMLAHLPTVGFVESRDLNADTFLRLLGAGVTDEMPMPPRLARALLVATKRGDAATADRPGPRLTPREQEALELLVDGLSNRQIARRLSISEHGAKRHVANILGKLNCSNRTLAAAIALRTGMCTSAQPDRVPVLAL